MKTMILQTGDLGVGVWTQRLKLWALLEPAIAAAGGATMPGVTRLRAAVSYQGVCKRLNQDGDAFIALADGRNVYLRVVPVGSVIVPSAPLPAESRRDGQGKSCPVCGATMDVLTRFENGACTRQCPRCHSIITDTAAEMSQSPSGSSQSPFGSPGI